MLRFMICLFFCNTPTPEPQKRNRNVAWVVQFLKDLPRKITIVDKPVLALEREARLSVEAILR